MRDSHTRGLHIITSVFASTVWRAVKRGKIRGCPPGFDPLVHTRGVALLCFKERFWQEGSLDLRLLNLLLDLLLLL